MQKVSGEECYHKRIFTVFEKQASTTYSMGGMVASWFVHSPSRFEPWPRTLHCALEQDIISASFHPGVKKLVPAN